MLRVAFNRLQLQVARPQVALAGIRWSSGKPAESDEAFDARWESYFQRKEIDGWELRRGLNELYGHDLVPEPKIISAALQACRRLNDYPMTVRIFEMVKDKSCGDQEIYNYIIQQCKPTIEELGLSTPEELGLA